MERYAERMIKPGRTTALIVGMMLLASVGAVLSTIAAPRVQESVTIQDAAVIGAASLQLRAGQTSTLSAATFSLAPGQSTMPLTSRGVLLIVVQSGTIRLLSDRAPSDVNQRSGSDVVAGIPVVGGEDTVSPRVSADGIEDGTSIGVTTGIEAYTLSEGFAFTVDPGAWMQFQGGTQAQLLIVSVQPK